MAEIQVICSLACNKHNANLNINEQGTSTMSLIFFLMSIQISSLGLVSQYFSGSSITVILGRQLKLIFANEDNVVGERTMLTLSSASLSSCCSTNNRNSSGDKVLRNVPGPFDEKLTATLTFAL